MEEVEPEWAEWPHVCAQCGEVLTPTLRSGWGDVQWLHNDVRVDHVAEPRLLPPT